MGCDGAVEWGHLGYGWGEMLWEGFVGGLMARVGWSIFLRERLRLSSFWTFW